MKKAILIPREGNDLYPLPSDYESLTADGKRLARVNACRQWTLSSGTPVDIGDRAVASLWFFDTHYLHPDPDNDFDPLFYDQAPRETPAYHWEIVRSWATNRLNVAMAPRGGAKSTLCRKDMLLRMVSEPAFSFVYATSTHDNAKHTGQIVKDQCYNNSRIHDDFGLLRPARGAKPTGTEYFHLTNGSYLRCVSAESRLRGLRPRRFRLDDPEYDERASTSMSTLRTYMDNLLFRVVLLMVMRGNCGADWIGTFVSKRHFLWHAMQVVQSPSGPVAADPRFNHWYRLWIRAATEDADGRLISCWPDMWPATIAEKEASGNSHLVSLEEMRSILGPASFASEMLGRPGTSIDQYLKLDTDPRGRHAYWFENVDDALSTAPSLSTASICFLRDGALVREPLSAFLTNARLFMTVDTAFTENATSDRRVCHLLAITSRNELFSFDLWSDRKPDNILLHRAFTMTALWRCPLIFIEVVRESFKLYQRFRSAVATTLITDMGFSFIPGIRDLRPGLMDKTSKIAALDLRFEHSLVKLPLYRRYTCHPYSRLFDQIESFNPEADSGGLDKDDEIDTLSMSLFIIRGKLLRDASPSSQPLDPLLALREGRTHLYPGGPSILHGLPLSALDADTISTLLSSNPTPPSPTRTLV